MTNENKTTLHEKVIQDVEEVAQKIESRFQHGGQTEKNIQEFQQNIEEREASKEGSNWMEELDPVTLGILVVEIALVTYLILALAGYLPMF